MFAQVSRVFFLLLSSFSFRAIKFAILLITNFFATQNHEKSYFNHIDWVENNA